MVGDRNGSTDQLSVTSSSMMTNDSYRCRQRSMTNGSSKLQLAVIEDDSGGGSNNEQADFRRWRAALVQQVINERNQKWRLLMSVTKIFPMAIYSRVGKNYLASGWKQELITISQLLERIKSNECCPTTLTYLAQHPLFDQILQLREDIFIPDYCIGSGGELHSVNAWLGPVGTVTPLHHDPHHNLLAQVVGKKYVRLYPAYVTEELYPYSEPMLSNSSQVDLDNLDHVKFPRVENLPFMDCILEEGEMMYIPPKWWHYVRSLSTSFSVSFWWNVSDTDDDGAKSCSIN